MLLTLISDNAFSRTEKTCSELYLLWSSYNLELFYKLEALIWSILQINSWWKTKASIKSTIAIVSHVWHLLTMNSFGLLMQRERISIPPNKEDIISFLRIANEASLDVTNCSIKTSPILGMVICNYSFFVFFIILLTCLTDSTLFSLR